MKEFGAAWRLAVRNLLRNRRRTCATAVAIVFGFSALVLLGAYIVRAAYGLEAATVYLNLKGHVAVRKRGSLENFPSRPKRFVLDRSDIVKITSALERWRGSIEATGEFLTGSGLLTDGKRSAPVSLTGVDPALYPRLSQHPTVLRWAEDWAKFDPSISKMATNPALVSITPKLAESIGRRAPFFDFPESEREIQILVKTYERDLGAVDAELGPMHSTGIAFADMTSVIVPLRLIRELLATEGTEYIALFLRDGASVSPIAKGLRKELGEDYEVLTVTDGVWSQFYVGQMNFLYVMGGFFTVLILGTISLAIVNTTTLNLLERTREIGTLRAIGFSPSKIRGLFLREAVVLSLACIVIGTALAVAIASVVNSSNIRFNPPGAQGSVRFRLALHPLTGVSMAALLTLVTLGSTQIVTRRKSRSRVVTLLGETGA